MCIGFKVILNNQYSDGKSQIQMVKDHNVTLLSGVPTVLQVCIYFVYDTYYNRNIRHNPLVQWSVILTFQASTVEAVNEPVPCRKSERFAVDVHVV